MGLVAAAANARVVLAVLRKALGLVARYDMVAFLHIGDPLAVSADQFPSKKLKTH